MVIGYTLRGLPERTEVVQSWQLFDESLESLTLCKP